MSGIKITVELIDEREDAYLFASVWGEENWILKSEISEYSIDSPVTGDSFTIEIPEWLAFEKGFM